MDFPTLDYENKYFAIILSNNHYNETEETYICVMMSTKIIPSEYAFEVTPEMVDFEYESSVSYVRINLLATIHEEDLNAISKKGKMKRSAFDKLLSEVNRFVFLPEK